MKYILTIFILGVYTSAMAQVAIIEDADGYTNVRLKPDSKSEVLYKVKTNQVFWYGQEDYHSKSIDWVIVEIPKNNYSLKCGSLDNLVGFMHKSKIRPLNTVPEYTGTAISFSYTTKPFSEENKIIDYSNNWIVSINGLYPWGSDGKKPKTETIALTIKIDGNHVAVPQVLIGDIFECDNDFSIYQIGDTFMVHQWNSDGAGAYEIVWVINENSISQRLVGSFA